MRWINFFFIFLIFFIFIVAKSKFSFFLYTKAYTFEEYESRFWKEFTSCSLHIHVILINCVDDFFIFLLCKVRALVKENIFRNFKIWIWFNFFSSFLFIFYLWWYWKEYLCIYAFIFPDFLFVVKEK